MWAECLLDSGLVAQGLGVKKAGKKVYFQGSLYNWKQGFDVSQSYDCTDFFLIKMLRVWWYLRIGNFNSLTW